MNGSVPGSIEPTALLGQWQLDRQVHDERAGLSGTVSGLLTLTTEADQIAWREQGTLLWNGSHMPVSREYWLRRIGDEWWLHFADDRPFHAWRPGDWVDHPCGEDIYQGLITIAGPDEWHTVWRLQGPDTAQHLTTRYTRERRD